MRICLIGPSHPFRGGITHHTTLLCHHLRKRHQVSFYAFKRQYPKWLFPGRTDRDVSKKPLREDGAQHILDSINPVTWWAVYQRIKREAPDLVVIPWWTSFWTIQFWTIATLVKRFSSAKILFICHNVVDHEHHVFGNRCIRAVLSKGDHFFVHSENDARRLTEVLSPAAHITHAFHPLYDFFDGGPMSKTEAKKRLGLEGETVLCFGFVRPYKGVNHLLAAMPLILKRRMITLLVVGEFWEGRDAFAKEIKNLGLEDAVRVIDQYIPNEEVGLYFSAGDLIALPYVSGTGSGVIQIACGLEKPVVATRIGSLGEVVEDGKTGYLVNPGDPRALADAVLRFFEEQKEAEFVENIRHAKGRFSWERLVTLIETETAEAQANGRRISASPALAPLVDQSAKPSAGTGTST
jgi:glycosyltransferase involved in cell wall biosynthesis